MRLKDTVREASFLTFDENYVQWVLFDEVFYLCNRKFDGVCGLRLS
jgi:hypothetical protein